jgi:TatD DNase family protein
MLFDSHTHLDDSRFDEDREQVIKRALERGVEFMMNPGADLASSQRAVKLAKKYEMIYAAVGIHPHDAKDVDQMTLELIEQLAKEDKVKAIGEIGLDYHYDNSPREIQKQVFIEQIRMAQTLGLPIIIHDRDANQDVLDILKMEEAFENGVLMHCFSGSAELARQYVKLGAYLSIAGPLTYKNARKSHEVVMEVPLDRLMIETDAPYLTPMPFRGKRNEPAYVHFVCEEMAKLKGLTYEEVATQTKANAKKFFKIK